MNNGRVYWITGFSNSGKTTIGVSLYYKLKKRNKNIVILDGDLMKQIASGSEKVCYTIEDRMIRAKRYSLMAKLLADQGMWVIVCAIAMFDEIRDWNRQNIRGYIEIFLDVPDHLLRERDRKRLYEYKKPVDAQLPKNPDIILKNDGSVSIRYLVEQIEKILPQKEDDYDRDSVYWNEYYKRIINERVFPSDFALFISKRLKLHSHVLELGCGNGRDSLFFMEKGHNVIGVDGSDIAIEILNNVTQNEENVLFVCDDFVKCHTLYQMKYDCIYSRFTLHAITETQENELLNNVKEALDEEGIFCIEARTIHDDIYGMGDKIGHNSFLYNNHFRRFINVVEFESKMKRMGFNILLIEERRGFSKTDESDPVLMRCIACINKHSQ